MYAIVLKAADCGHLIIFVRNVGQLIGLSSESAQDRDGSILQIVVLRDVVGLHRRFAPDQSLSNPTQTKFDQRP